MMSCTASATWSHHVSSSCYTEHGQRWGHVVCGSTRALLSRRQGRGHVAAPEPTLAGRRAPELRNTWQRRSSPLGEAEPEAMRHVVALEPTSVGRRGLELRNV
jgi:hypothetical protein